MLQAEQLPAYVQSGLVDGADVEAVDAVKRLLQHPCTTVLSLSLSLSLGHCLCLSLFLSLFRSLFFSLSLFLSLYLSFSLSLSLSLFFSLFLSRGISSCTPPPRSGAASRFLSLILSLIPEIAFQIWLSVAAISHPFL